MAYFLNANEQYEYTIIDGEKCLLIIHDGHSHNGMKPHAHVLGMSGLTFGEAWDERTLNIYCGKAKDSGKVIPWR